MITKRAVLLASLLAVAIAWRLVNAQWQLAPGVELLTGAAIASAAVSARRSVLFVPMLGVVLSDAIIGNSPIVLFTWSAWLVVGVAALLVRRAHVRSRPLLGAGVGAATSTWFFLWTNLGVWLQSAPGGYPHTAAGLVECYVAGLPFFRIMLIGNLLFVPLFMWISQLALRRSTDLRPRLTSAVLR